MFRKNSLSSRFSLLFSFFGKKKKKKERKKYRNIIMIIKINIIGIIITMHEKEESMELRRKKHIQLRQYFLFRGVRQNRVRRRGGVINDEIHRTQPPS